MRLRNPNFSLLILLIIQLFSVGCYAQALSPIAKQLSAAASVDKMDVYGIRMSPLTEKQKLILARFNPDLGPRKTERRPPGNTMGDAVLSGRLKAEANAQGKEWDGLIEVTTGGSSGVFVDQVSKNGPMSGLQAGDVLLEVRTFKPHRDSKSLRTPSDVKEFLERHSGERRVPMQFGLQRGEKTGNYDFSWSTSQ